MPAPPPVLLTSFNKSYLSPFDCVCGQQLGDNGYDEQLYETVGGKLSDSKKLLMRPFVPFRMVSMIGGPTLGIQGGPGHSSLDEVYAAFKPGYWDYCPWGTISLFQDVRDVGGLGTEIRFFPYSIFQGGFTGGGGLDNSPPVGVGIGGIYLAAFTTWTQSAFLTPPTYIRVLRAFQVINPDQLKNLNYQVWRVTGRWFWRSNTGTYDDDGYPGAVIPSPYPWSLSSDFTLLAEGALKPFEILTIGPYDLDPVTAGDCQSPPAPSNNAPDPNAYGLGTYSDWDGFAVAAYVVFV